MRFEGENKLIIIYAHFVTAAITYNYRQIFAAEREHFTMTKVKLLCFLLRAPEDIHYISGV